MTSANPSSILSHVPLWVPLLLLLLIAIGLLQRRSRDVRPVVTDVVAVALLALSIMGVQQAFGLKPEAVVAWIFGVGLAQALGDRFFGAGGLTPAESRKVHVPGSWVPMVLMMGIFALRFVVGAAQGAGLAFVSTTPFAAIISFGLGVCSGGFLARALAIRRCVRRPAADGRAAVSG